MSKYIYVPVAKGFEPVLGSEQFASAVLLMSCPIHTLLHCDNLARFDVIWLFKYLIDLPLQQGISPPPSLINCSLYIYTSLWQIVGHCSAHTVTHASSLQLICVSLILCKWRHTQMQIQSLHQWCMHSLLCTHIHLVIYQPIHMLPH
jgi:hypothetical protein